jgi:hypothetical protein
MRCVRQVHDVLGHPVSISTSSTKMDTESLNDLILNDTWSSDIITPPQPFRSSQVVDIVIIAIIVALAIGGNIFVVWVVVAHERMRTVTNYFLVNMAIADLIYVTFCSLPLSVDTLIDHWVFGRVYCKLLFFMGLWMIMAKVTTLMAVAVER